MIRLYVLGEGRTEEALVNRVLVPHLSACNVFPSVRSVGGGSRWAPWRAFIERLMKQERGDDVRFTTILDLYRLPKDFPEAATCRAIADTGRRTELLEQAMTADLGDPRLIPYIQRHEIESLVLACLDELAARLPAARRGIEDLREAVGTRNPEEVNDGPETHPSRLLERHVARYGKLADGPAVIAQAGLTRVRAACPRFDAWLGALESLAGTPPAPTRGGTP